MAFPVDEREWTLEQHFTGHIEVLDGPAPEVVVIGRKEAELPVHEPITVVPKSRLEAAEDELDRMAEVAYRGNEREKKLEAERNHWRAHAQRVARDEESERGQVRALREALRDIDFCLTTVEGDNVPRGTGAALRARGLARAALAALPVPDEGHAGESVEAERKKPDTTTSAVPDEAEATGADLNDGRDRQVRGAGCSDATKTAPGPLPAVAVADYATGPPSLPVPDEGTER